MRYLFSAFFLLFFLSGFAQPKNIKVKGIVYDFENNEPVKNVLVSVYGGDSLFQKQRTEKDGVFKFNLEYGYNYVILFEKLQYYKKFVNVNAYGLSRDDISFAQKFGDWEVYLFGEVKGLDARIFEESAGVIFFDRDEGFFDWDANYLEYKREEFEEFEEEYKRQKEENLRNRIENYSSGFDALNKNARPIEEIVPKQEKEVIQQYDERLINALKSLDRKVYEEYFDRGSYYIIERTVVYEGRMPVKFTKVVHDWGGKYYFREGVSITGLQFDLLTNTEPDYAPSIND